MSIPALEMAHAPALVSRRLGRPCDPTHYLLFTPQGAPSWTCDPRAATSFESMREATRAALRLPGPLRAFGLPRGAELMTQGQLH